MRLSKTLWESYNVWTQLRKHTHHFTCCLSQVWCMLFVQNVCSLCGFSWLQHSNESCNSRLLVFYWQAVKQSVYLPLAVSLIHPVYLPLAFSLIHPVYLVLAFLPGPPCSTFTHQPSPWPPRAVTHISLQTYNSLEAWPVLVWKLDVQTKCQLYCKVSLLYPKWHADLQKY